MAWSLSDASDWEPLSPNSKKKSFRTRYSVLNEAGQVDSSSFTKWLNRDFDDAGDNFWQVLKSLIVKRFDNTEKAFRAYSDPDDEVMTEIHFEKLCSVIGFSLIDRDVLRRLFQLQLPAGESDLTLAEFQDAIGVDRIDRIKCKLQEYNNSVGRIVTHIDYVIRYLALESGERNARRALTRFQRKLSSQFYINLWQGLQAWATRRITEVARNIDCDSFVKVCGSCGGVTFQLYELEFFANLFEYVDRRQRGHVALTDVAVACMLLSTEITRLAKVGIIFTIFDTDGDTCLNAEQILSMYSSICIQTAIITGDQKYLNADVTLGDELSLSKARRLHESTMLYLTLSGVHDVCTFQELSLVIESHALLLDELVPGTFSVTWILRPLSGVYWRPDGNKKKMRSAARRSLTEQNAEAPTARLSNKKIDRKQSSQQLMNATGRHMETMENFRTHTQMVFKHSLSGEWDVVDALQAYDKMQLTSAAGSRGLPSINDQGISRPGSKQRRGSKLSKVQSLPNLGSVQQRQRRRPHSQSSSNNRQAGKISRQGSMAGSSDPTSMQMDSGHGAAEQLKARADRKFAAIVQEETDVFGAQPLQLQKYDASSFKRFRTMAKVSTKSQNIDPGNMPTESFVYHCQLCFGCHDVSVPCV